MNPNERPIDERMTSLQAARIESAVAHQQHAHDVLNEVVVEQAKVIDALQRRVKKLEATLADLQHQIPGEPRDLMAEKPPHY